MKNSNSSVSIKQIAEKAGMSQSTVSIVLNGRGDEMRISKKTQQHILDVASSLNYEPGSSGRRARGLSDIRGRKTIAVYWNKRLAGEGLGIYFEGVFKTIEEHSYGLEVVLKMFNEERLCEDEDILNPVNYSGIIVNGATAVDVAFLENRIHDVPIVLTSQLGRGLSSVHVDNYMAGMEVARLFAEAGYKRGAAVVTNKPSSGSKIRHMGFLDGCARYGIETRDSWNIIADDDDFRLINPEILEVMKQDERPDCMFILRAITAPGILAALKDEGIRVPEDVAVIGYGHATGALVSAFSPNLSMVGSSMSSFGAGAVDLLMTVMNNKITVPINTVVPCTFYFKETFKPKTEE